MGSSGNTGAPLNLNQWVGSDHPKRVDFNEDNRKTNQLAGTLLETEEIIEGNEAQRKANELERQDNEITRQASETDRVAAEIARAAAETARIAAEASRSAAETTRQSYYNACRVMENYSASKSYVPGNKVQYNGSTYQCIAASKGNAPPNATYWQLIAAKGASGGGSGDMVVADYGGSDGNTVHNSDNLGGKPAAQYVLSHDESTGAIAQIQAIRGAPLSVQTEAIATQSGEGDPSPDNIRPIVGRGSVKINVTGKNLTNAVFLRGAYENYTGVYSTSYYPNYVCTGKMQIVEGVQCALSLIKPEIARLTNMHYWDARGTWIGNTAGDNINNRPKGSAYMAANFFADGQTIDIASFSALQLELGPAATPYEPYAGVTYPIPLPQTIYGLPNLPDTIDCESGAVSVEQKTEMIALNGTEPWATNGAGATMIYRIPIPGKSAGNAGMCSHYTPQKISSTTTTIGYSLQDSTLQLQFRPDLSLIPDVETWKAYLAAQYAAGTPVQVLYRLATPTGIGFASPEIVAVDGQNNVWSDGGGMTTAKYDLADYFSKFNNALNALAGV